MKMTKKNLIYLLCVLCLSACEKSNSNGFPQSESINPNYITRTQYDHMLEIKKLGEEASQLMLQTKESKIIELKNNIDRFTEENQLLRTNIKSLNWFLESKHDKDRREIALWGADNWFWVHECSEWSINGSWFPLCQFTDQEIQKADQMVGKGYPIEPTEILLYMPLALGYLFLMGLAMIFAAGVLLWSLLQGFLWMFTKPGKALLFELDPLYRAKIIGLYKESYIPFEEQAKKEKLLAKNAQRSLELIENRSVNAKKILDNLEIKINENNSLFEESQRRNNQVNKEYKKIIENCIDHFLQESHRREIYIKKLRQNLMFPISRQFEEFSGMAPTQETLRKIESSELKTLLVLNNFDEDEFDIEFPG